MNEIVFRPANDTDLPSFAAIHIDAVDTLGPRAYTADQIAAWRRWPGDEPDEFRRRLTAGHCRVAEIGGAPVAFAVFTPPDHLDFLYTSGEFAGRGLATKIHEQLETIARDSGSSVLRTEASYLSRPVFNRLGYDVIEIEDVVRFGETFRRFKMRKILRPGPPATGPERQCIRAHGPSFDQSPRVLAEERITFKRHDENNPGWFEGTDVHGVSGYFPTEWFLIEASANSAIALRNYSAAELAVQIGDSVHLIESVGPWVQVIDLTGKNGWVRRNRLENEPAS
ncbi:MAG: GNAT family N-acetyltransferase [Verrucomicrobiia bacterium]|tara:strand:+ start:9796 stop:10641 length:846 start_codon:yes stop_codon:yes gene_type:complete